MHRYLSLDIGGTNLKYGLIDAAGNLIFKQHRPTPLNQTDFIQVFKAVIAAYQDEIYGVAISVPGQVDSQKGIVFHGGSLPFLDQFDFKTLIQTEFGALPVGVENDGKAGALAESWLGVLKGHPNAAALILGTGVGGGIILNNQLLQGSHFQAGELSFMLTSDSNQGAVELVGMADSAVEMIRQIATVLKLPDHKDGIAVFEQLSQQNQAAWTIFKAYCRRIAELILTIQTVVDLTHYAIGGGISSQPLLVSTINQEYDQLLNALPLIKTTLTRPQIKKAKFENSANLYGALYGLLQKLD